MQNISLIIFVFLVLCADLKVTMFSSIHWVAWLILVFPWILLSLYRTGIKKTPTMMILIIVFLISILVSSFNETAIESLIQCVKFMFIFLTFYYFVYYNPIEWRLLYRIINIVVLANFIMLIMGVIGISTLSKIMTGDGRWGTFLAFPGSLVKIGSYGFYINLMFLLTSKGVKRILPAILTVFSIFIVYMDGSRTGMLVILITVIFIPLLYAFINRNNKIKTLFVPLVIYSSIVLLVGIFSTFLTETRIWKNIDFLISSSDFMVGLQMIDPARFIMYQEAVNKIIYSPFIGTGTFTTTDLSGMVVHNTYLEVWGDFGLIGFICIISIYLGWIFYLPNIIKNFNLNDDIINKTVASISILMLTYFVFNGLFHPYSTEFSEWITFIIPYSIYYSYWKKNKYEYRNMLRSKGVMIDG